LLVRNEFILDEVLGQEHVWACRPISVAGSQFRLTFLHSGGLGMPQAACR